jgi:hypothetical protein
VTLWKDRILKSSIAILIYGGIAFLILLALSPLLLMLFQGSDDGIPGPFGPACKDENSIGCEQDNWGP